MRELRDTREQQLLGTALAKWMQTVKLEGVKKIL